VDPRVNDLGWHAGGAPSTWRTTSRRHVPDGLSALPWAEDLLDFQVDSVALMSEMERSSTATRWAPARRSRPPCPAPAAEELPLPYCPPSSSAPPRCRTSGPRRSRSGCPASTSVIMRGSAAKRRKIIEDAMATSRLARGRHRPRDDVGLAPHPHPARRLRLHPPQAVRGVRPPRRGPGCSRTSCEVHKRELNGGWVRTVIADEAHKAKDPKAKQTRALWAVGQEATYRWPMTGTPVAVQPEDLWALLHFVDPRGVALARRRSSTATRPRRRPVGTPGVRVQPGDQARTGPPHGAVLHLPAQVPHPCLAPAGVLFCRRVEMEPKQAKAYASMADHMLANSRARSSWPPTRS
jgi:hypothetical protein